jgi:putative ABC transport system permease protein
MPLSALDQKLLRDIGRLKGQVATIALVLAGGIASFIGMRGTYESLDWSREAYYDRYRFADVFASLERAPETLSAKIESLPNVELVETRITEEVTVPIEGMERPAYAKLLSLPASGQPATNAICLLRGRLPDRGKEDEVVVLDAFAAAHGLEPGHRLPAVLNGKLRQLRIVGLAMSPEYVYAIRPGALMDDPQRYAVLWMDRSVLASAFQLGSAFNEVSLRLQPEASEPETIAALDRLLAPYGGLGAYPRKDQASNKILVGELGQLQALAGMVPIVFLGVAAFLINIVLTRLIALQRMEIAALKAVGYTNREVGRHYLGLVALILAPGLALGTAGGIGLGHLTLGLYEGIFRFPDLAFRITGSLLAGGFLVSSAAAIAGALLAVRAAVKLPPAEAMRPPAPANYRKSLLERLGLGALLGPTGLMIYREISRRPLRTALSSVGIAGAVALLILGRFGLDSLDAYLEGTLKREQRQDLAVAFLRPVSPRAIGELGRLNGVLRAEGLRGVPIRARHDHLMRDTALLGLPNDGSLRRLVERDGHAITIPEDGVVLTSKLAEVLEVQVGDRIDLELREGERGRVRPVVTGLIDESVGMSVYARIDVVQALEKDQGAVSSVLLSVEPRARAGIEEHLKKTPRVIDVSDVRGDTERLRDMNGSIMNVWTTISISLSAMVIFGVVYNNARISLAMKSRDLASLRVLGFSRREISTVLIGGLVVEVGLGIPVGLIVGRLWAGLFMSTVDQETFRWSVVVSPTTYAMAAAVAVLASAASALWVRRGLDRLDLIGVLKTRE